MVEQHRLGESNNGAREDCASQCRYSGATATTGDKTSQARHNEKSRDRRRRGVNRVANEQRESGEDHHLQEKVCQPCREKIPRGQKLARLAAHVAKEEKRYDRQSETDHAGDKKRAEDKEKGDLEPGVPDFAEYFLQFAYRFQLAEVEKERSVVGRTSNGQLSMNRRASSEKSRTAQ